MWSFPSDVSTWAGKGLGVGPWELGEGARIPAMRSETARALGRLLQPRSDSGLSGKLLLDSRKHWCLVCFSTAVFPASCLWPGEVKALGLECARASLELPLLTGMAEVQGAPRRPWGAGICGGLQCLEL